LASVQRKNPKAFLVSTQPNLIVRTPFCERAIGRLSERAFLTSPVLPFACSPVRTYWRSIQLATRRTNNGPRTRSFQTQIVNQQNRSRGIPFSALLFLSRRATQDNKIRVFVNSSKGVGPLRFAADKTRIKRSQKGR
jgi:hypothetical protein